MPTPSRRRPDAHQLQERRAVGERIRHLRRSHGMTQERLAEIIGRDRQTIRHYEHGMTSAGVDDLVAIARAFSVPTWRLFYG
ncbi:MULTISPECIES: helix-turn-helix domain-containing protein [Kitasatospora]|uniref:Helix-turn-helix transcriptional regulator n=1 Tax=Kitasatospora cathayae TaxID=3004092 RepID=A0ABY7QBR6_9ACTN|nr:helix-turn-helix transcriptional regulator [Kitasatospora sp. HUAS 3-15]WBP89556.1 helix-turn-helix transcriptional regulator [Kitasatospora sp. HUAS 3-15]